MKGLGLTFRDLDYTVYVAKTRGKPASTKKILSGVSGACKAGHVSVIMGPSGAGKTSLLDILAGRKAQSNGELCLGKLAGASAAEVRRQAAYVQQDDAIMASQTIREAVTMAALLTLPRDLPKQHKLDSAAKVLRTFQLEACADTLVGDPVGKVKGVSGGERKRCAVAMNAVSNPPILFLDEPTSGLDTHKAFLLMQVLKDMAGSLCCTVVCTIHQPSSDIFALFDDLMLLLEGKHVFAGPARRAVEHFANAGFPCPRYANPTDFFFMHVLSTPEGAAADGRRRDELVTTWESSELHVELQAMLGSAFGTPGSPSAGRAASPRGAGAGRVGGSYVQQFLVLFRRGVNDIRRNPMRGKAPIAQAVIFALIIALIWAQVHNDQNGLQDRNGALYFMTANGMMQNIMGVLTAFGNERGAVLREQDNGMYRTFPYFVARVMVDIPLKVLQPCIFGTISYWALGFQPSGEKYVICIIILVLLALAGNAIGLFIACVFQDLAVALMVAPLAILPLMMFSGFFINPDSMPVYLAWIQWISPMKYAYSALAKNEFSGLDLYCKADQLRSVVTGAGRLEYVCPYPSGDLYLDSLNIQPALTILNCCLLLALLAVVFTTLAFFGLSMITSAVQAKSRAASVKDKTARHGSGKVEAGSGKAPAGEPGCQAHGPAEVVIT